MTKDEPDRTVERAWTRLARAARHVTDAIEADLRAAALPPLAWDDVLLELERADGHALRPFELEARLLLAQYNLSRLIDRIVAAGYVQKRPVTSDRRGHEIVLLPAGAAIRARMWPVYAAAIERHLGAGLDRAQTEALAELLESLLRAGATPGSGAGP